LQFIPHHKMTKITTIRCDPIDLKAALSRLNLPDINWSLSADSGKSSTAIYRLIEPIEHAKAVGGINVWRNYLTALACLDAIEQQTICDLLHDLYYTNSDCEIILIQTDLSPIPNSVGFLIEDKITPLPTAEEIESILTQFSMPLDERMLRLSTGLSHSDLELCLSDLHLDNPHQQLEQFRAKRLALKDIKYEPVPMYTEMGGLDLLEDWIGTLEYRLSPAAEKLRLPHPKGVLLGGLPGTGKTFAARAIAARLGYPMFSLNVDAVQAGGANKLLATIATIESCAPCILFIDEIEKLFSGEVDGKVLAIFLAWLNDKVAKVYVIGTFNRIEKMPMEITRAGRFDRTFFIDSPGEGQRVELCRLFLKRFDDRFLDPDDSVFSSHEWQYFADTTIEYIGAEIQQIVGDTVAHVKQKNPENIVTIDDLIYMAAKFKSMYKRDPIGVAKIRNTLSGKADPASSNSRKFLPDRTLDIYAPIGSK
jgi:ATPase family associated with various cellular activities (AAA)